MTTSSSATTSATTASNPATSETVTSPSTSTKATTGTIPSNNGAATAFLPAYFFAAPDGSLSPRTIAAPAATTILLTVTSRATHPLTIAVAGRSLSVPTHGRLSARLAGLKPARYPVTVDGTPRAAIVVGAQPGP
ncbi:MAG TPA: hypothetical protein VGF81_06840 [Solirubrobacteraceae bacterium]